MGYLRSILSVSPFSVDRSCASEIPLAVAVHWHDRRRIRRWIHRGRVRTRAALADCARRPIGQDLRADRICLGGIARRASLDRWLDDTYQ